MKMLYENIKKRRNELQLTQAQLAALTGYADKSMIAKVEKGLVDLPQSKIDAFAKALLVTPIELTGAASFQSTSDQISAAANFFDLCLGRIGWTREWDDEKGKYAFRKNDVTVYFSADEYAELSDGIEKSVEDTILSAIREKIIK